MGYILLPSNLNTIIGITSFYCVILKMMILHDEIKTIQNRAFVLFIKKEEKSVSIQKTQKTELKKQVGWVYLKNGFFSILVIFQPFFEISP